jgi:hypothetical protein
LSPYRGRHRQAAGREEISKALSHGLTADVLKYV